MSSRTHRQHGHRHRPPHGRPPWAGGDGRRFLRRAALALTAVLLMLATMVLLLAALAALAAGLIPAPPPARVAAVIALALIALALVSGAGAVGRGARRFGFPIAQLVDAAGRIEAGDYSARLEEPRQPHLRRVARAFNSMSARLEAIDAGRRAFLADIAHELRTPLSVVRGQAEGIADGLYPASSENLAPILAATATLERLVDDLRTLSQAQAGALPLHREAFDLSGLVAQVVTALKPIADARGTVVDTDIAEEIALDADPARVAIVLQNLVANAIAHSPPGRPVRVSARRDAGMVAIRVEDSGPGLPDEIADRVFERFVKDPGSTGSGLGLAIAREIVLAHGGTAAAGNRQPGAWFEVRLPAAG